MAGNDAVFNEVIDVSFDQAAFQAQLDELVARYSEALKGMGDGGSGLMTTLNVSAFNAQLSGLQTQLKEFATGFQSAFDVVAQEVVKQTEQVSAKTSEAVDKTAAKLQDLKDKQAAAANKQEVKDDSTVRQRELDELENYIRAHQAEVDLIDKEMAKYEELHAARKASYQKFDDNQNKTQGKQASQVNLQSNKDAEEQRARELAELKGYILQKYAAEAEEVSKEENLNGLRARQNAQSLAQEVKDTQEARAKELSDLKLYIQQKYAAEAEANKGQNTAAIAADIARIKELYAELAASAKRAMSEASKGGNDDAKAFAKQAASSVQEIKIALGEATAAAKDFNVELSNTARQTAEAASVAGKIAISGATENISGLRGFVNELPGLLGNVLKFQLAWSIIGKVVTGVAKVLESPFIALKDGAEYLTLMEQRADMLAGIIQANVQYSANLAENFKIAQEQAAGVAARLRDVAIKDNLNPEQLINSFKALVENGVMNYVKDMSDAVTLTEDLNVAIKASGVSVETTRRIQSEIPKLLSGQVTGHEATLRVLHMTADQWTAMLATAKEHGNLVDLLAAKMEPYRQALGLVHESQQGLLEQVKEMFQEVEGHFAKGLWEQWNQMLKAARDFLRDNGAAIYSMAEQMGGVVSQTSSLVGQMFLLAGALVGIRGDFGSMAGLVATLVNLTENFVIRLTGAAQIFQNLVKFGQDLLNPSGYSKDEFDEDAAKISKKNQEDLKASDERYQSTINALYGIPDQDKSGDLNRHGGAKNPPPPGAKPKTQADHAEQDAKSQMDSDLALARNLADARINGAKEEFAQRDINEKQLHDRTLSALVDERAAVEAIVKTYKDFLDSLPSKTKADKNSKDAALNGADTTETNFATGIDKSISDANTKLETSNFNLAKAQSEEAIRQARDTATQKIAAAKLSGATHEQVAQMEMAADVQEYSARRALMQEEIDRFRADTNEKILLQQKLKDYDTTEKSKLGNDSQKVVGAGIEDEYQQIVKSSAATRNKISAEAALAEQYSIVGTTAKQYADIQAKLAQESAAAARTEETITLALLNKAKARGADVTEINKLTDAYNKAAGSANVADKRSTDSTQKAAGTQNILTDIFGDGVTSADQFGKTEKMGSDGKIGFNQDTTTSLRELGNGFKYFDQSVKSLSAAFHQGIGQGIGAAASQAGNMATGAAGLFDKASAAGKAFPIVGAALSAIGPLISGISDMFTAAARQIGENIQRAFKQTMTDYAAQNATLSQTIVAVEAERSSAISQLSGKKGGTKELNQLLPTLDSQLASLKIQQRDLKIAFQDSLQVLKLQSDPLSSMYTTWQAINKQVKDYIGAGGDAAAAQQFMSLSLKKLQLDAATALHTGDQTAIQDALTLNGLLQQRLDLEKNYRISRFQAINGDALERRASNAVTVGTQLNTQDTAYQLQITALNNQIALTQGKVDLEREIYTIAQDTATLNANSNALALQDLQLQVNKLKDYKSIMEGIYQQQNGSYALGSQLASLVGAQVGTINVIVNTQGGDANGSDIASEIQSVLSRQGRYGAGTNFSKLNAA